MFHTTLYTTQHQPKPWWLKTGSTPASFRAATRTHTCKCSQVSSSAAYAGPTAVLCKLFPTAGRSPSTSLWWLAWCPLAKKMNEHWSRSVDSHWTSLLSPEQEREAWGKGLPWTSLLSPAFPSPLEMEEAALAWVFNRGGLSQPVTVDAAKEMPLLLSEVPPK